MATMGMLLAIVGGSARECGAQTTQPATPATVSAQELVLDLGDQVTMKLLQIPMGKFLMGSPASERGRHADETLHAVTISKPFYMGLYPVTVNQYAQFAKATGVTPQDPGFQQAGDHPVVCIDWQSAQAFCAWLSKKTGKQVALPTEAQREYACRAGTKTRFSFGNNDSELFKYANYCDKSNTIQLSRANVRDTAHSDGFDRTSPVGAFKPNPWGLYDMHGDVWEWCSDYYADRFAGTAAKDPTGPASGTDRVLRGGCWVGSVFEGYCRSASRVKSKPDWRYFAVGLRVVVLTSDKD